MKGRKILYGVCGIGKGHTYRQLPIIERLSRDNNIVIFSYGNSLKVYIDYFTNHPNVEVVEVEVPYFIGDSVGIDFLATARLAQRSKVNSVAKNALAMGEATRLTGRPDLVISDYEPISGQYAYAHDAPLITIDQQSKYLGGGFPEVLAGLSYKDEIMRLRMFFPIAHARVACSFFSVKNEPGTSSGERKVLIVPPVLRPEVGAIKRSHRVNTNLILVYLTDQKGFLQPLDQIIQVLKTQTEYDFHIFVPQVEAKTCKDIGSNVVLHAHGEPEFDLVLGDCAGLITTAGHTLLAEAMHIGIPVYALPLPLYEQQMNAHIIQKYNFGISAKRIDKNNLSRFLLGLSNFTDSIRKDTSVLLRGDGPDNIIDLLETSLGN